MLWSVIFFFFNVFAIFSLPSHSVHITIILMTLILLIIQSSPPFKAGIPAYYPPTCHVLVSLTFLDFKDQYTKQK